MELSQQSVTFCSQILRSILKKNVEARNYSETLNLLLDIYKTYKKCNKYMTPKETFFTQLLVEAYKFYIEKKVPRIPDHMNLLDLAIKLCVQENRKNQEKLLGMSNSVNSNTNTNDLSTTQQFTTPQVRLIKKISTFTRLTVCVIN